MKTISRFITVLSIFLLTVYLPAKGISEAQNPEPAQKTFTFSIGVLKGPSGFGIIKLVEELKLLPENVAVEYHILSAPEEMVARLTSREFQAGLLPLNVAAKLYTKAAGYPLAAIPGRGALYILSRNTEINTWEDLVGQTVYAIGKGATPDYLLQYFLAKKNIDASTILVNFSIPSPQLAQMAAAGKVDTLLLPQPFSTLVQAKSPDITVRLDFQETWMEVQGVKEPYPITAFVVDSDFSLQRPEAFLALLKAYKESIDWVLQNPQEAAELIEKHGILASGPAKAAIPHCGLSFTSASNARPNVETYLQVLLEANPVSIGGALPDENFYLP